MIKNILKNYMLSIFLAGTLFAVSLCFCRWFYIESLLSYFSASVNLIQRSFFITAFFGILAGLIVLGLLFLVLKLFFRIFNIYNLPFRDIFFIALAFGVARNLILGILNLTFFFAPFVVLWGNVFNFLATVPMVLLFFNTVNRLYLNPKSAPHFFKSLCIAFCVCFAASVVFGGFSI